MLGIVIQARTGHRHFGEYYQTHSIWGPANCPCRAELQVREHIVFECQMHKEYGNIIEEGAPLTPWPNSSEKARCSRKREPQISYRRHQMQSRVIRDPDVQQNPIGTLPDPPHPTKTSPTKCASNNRAYWIMYQTRQRTLETILENILLIARSPVIPLRIVL